MVYEYALISVVIASGYWGYFFVRHQPSGTPLFGMMQLAAAAACGLGLLGRRYDHAALGIAGAIGLGAGACLLVVGPMVRGLARRFAAVDRLGIAARLLDVAELIAPGSGVAEDKALLGAMREIREGRIEQTVDALTATKDQVPVEARLAIDERIAMLYLAAYRWNDAIAHAETHLGATFARDVVDESPAGLLGSAVESTALSLRDALGIAPPVWVELLGAYGRTGNLDQAARMMSRLEDVCSGRDDAALWLHRARLMFLALAGRPDAVRALVEPRHARHMTVAARTYWVAVAHQHRGDREAASAAFAKARGRSRGRPRALIEEALAALAATIPVALSPEATTVVTQVEAAPPPAAVRMPGARGPWATWGLTASLLIVAVAIAAAIGPSSDPGVLLRSGAMVRGRIDAGEWWRLVSCVFVHVGTMHLAVNVIGLYFLGRIVEELFGTARTIAIFGGSGVAGAVASYLASPAGVSAGASGAIFGVLGAAFIELTLHRRRYRSAWKRGMWGGLAVVTLAQALIGFLYPAIDQWAHGGGLFAGVVLGAALSPSVGWARYGRQVGRALAVGLVAVAAIAATMIGRTSIADAFDGPETQHEVGAISVTAPASWRAAHGELVDPDGLVICSLASEGAIELREQLEDWTVKSIPDARERGFDGVAAAFDRVVALPDGWIGTERIATVEDALDQVQRYRLVIAGKRFGDRVILMRLFAPDTVAHAASQVFSRLIESIRPR